MESTGVYWRPVYETIEAESERYDCLMVVNAHHMRNLPGRKSDVKDAEWIATLLRHGLLENSFIPERTIRDIREFSRLRRSMTEERTRHINRVEKFLQTHGFKLSSVLNDILCVSGRKLLDTLAQTGTLTPEDISNAAGRRLKRPVEEVAAAVCGSINRAEQSILRLLLKQLSGVENDLSQIDLEMKDLSAQYERPLAVLDSVPGIDTLSAVTILGEIGSAPHKAFATPGHLCSWAGLTSRNDESAGKVKCKRILPGNPYIKTVLCQVAWAAVRTRNSIFHAWFWSHQGRLGRKKAIIAVARKLLKLIYRLLEQDRLFEPDLTA
jgi:transposase